MWRQQQQHSRERRSRAPARPQSAPPSASMKPLRVGLQRGSQSRQVLYTIPRHRSILIKSLTANYIQHPRSKRRGEGSVDLTATFEKKEKDFILFFHEPDDA